MSRGPRTLAAVDPRALAALGLVAALVGVPVEPVRADSTICVGIVVDYGEAKPGSGANSICVRVPPGASGAVVLAARAQALGRPAPTYGSNGLLCTIDGYPNDGTCADPAPGGGFRFWSYWHQLPGSSTWVCAGTGPVDFTVRDGSMEGWSFQVGGAVCNRPPPSESYGSVCRVAASPTPPKSSATPRPAPSRPAAGLSPRGSAASTGGRPSPSTGARPVITGTPLQPSPSNALVTVAPSSPTASPSASSRPEVTALSPVEPPPTSPYRAPIATLAGLALAGGIGAAALLRSRRTRREDGG